MSTPEFKKQYQEQIAPALLKELGLKNIHQVPAIEKVVINSGVSSAHDKSVMTDTAKDIGAIAGQKPITTKARKSISNFKLRQGMPIGVKVTLRGNQMYDFLFRLINIALPVIRDFRGVSSKLDGNGNYNIGISDHSIFPEISLDNIKRTTGMDITIVTTTRNDESARLLLSKFGMPFRKKEAAQASA